MKRVVLYALACLFVFSGGTAVASEKIRMAVYDLEPLDVTKETAYKVTNLLRAEFFSTGRFVTTDEQTMKKLLKEQAFQQTGCTSSECAVEVGKILNVSIMATGAISKLGNSFNISVTLTDVERGETLQVEKDSCDTEDKLINIVKNIANAIALKMPITGKVVKVSADGNSVVVDLGLVDRVAKEMRFKVNRVKDEIKDSTGKVIMKEYEDIGEITLTEVQKDASRAAVSRKISTPKVGDDVKIGEEDLRRMNSESIQAVKQSVSSIYTAGTVGGSFIDPAWRSLILPGWGQFYNKDNFKGWVFTIAGLGSATRTVLQFLDYNRKKQDYDNISDPMATLETFDTAYEAANESYKEFNSSLRITAVVWGLGVIDAILSYDPKKPHASLTLPENETNGLFCKSDGLDSVKVGYTVKW